VVIHNRASESVFGLFDVMNGIGLMATPDADSAGSAPFQIEIVGETAGPLELASGVPITVQRTVDSITTSDVVIVPSIVLGRRGWRKGRYGRLIDWLVRCTSAMRCCARRARESFC
jgi:hypothetical protein